MGDKEEGTQLQRVESYQWPSGHVAHLSEGQLTALANFKQLCQEKGYYTPGDEKTPPTHDDETLLRYLRARKFVPQEAFVQFKDTEDWRQENQLETLYETIDVNEYDRSRRLYPQWTGRRDRRGIPFYVFDIGDVDPKKVSIHSNSKDNQNQTTNSKLPYKMLKLFALYENLCRFILPMCSAIPDRPHSETPISQSNNIVDLSGVGFTKLWNLRTHMSDASTLATAHYPETLDRIFVIGTPSYFPVVWQWAQRWFDPITVSKIFILTQKDMTSTLEKFVDIDSIPKKYGGNLDWRFGDMPNLEPAIADSLQWKERIEQRGYRTFPIGPIKWEYGDDGDLVATAVGTENGKPRNRVIAGLSPKAGVARLSLSPGRVGQSSIDTKPAVQTPTPKRQSTPPASNGEPAKMSSGGDLNVGKDPRSSLSGTSRAGTYTVSYVDDKNKIAAPPAGARQGTSSTRYEQQQGTHAEGQLADGTPELKLDGQGERQGIMEPNTVGQAPKEFPVPEPEQPQQPGVIEQAKDMAGQAAATVMSAVGMGGKKEEEVPREQGGKEDPKIDAMDSKNVEEFLRSKTTSKLEE